MKPNSHNENIRIIREEAPSAGYMSRFDLLSLSYSCLGLFTLMGSTILLCGRAVWLAYLAAIILGVFYIIPTAMVASSLNCGSGMYSLIAALLSPAAASLYCISNLLDVTMSLVALSFGSYIQSVFPMINYRIAGAVFLTAIFIINQLGLKKVSMSQNIMFCILAATLMLFIVCGLCEVDIGPAFHFHESGFFAGGKTGFISAVAILYYSSSSYVCAISYGRHSKNPYRDIPHTMFLSPAFLIVFFGLCTIITGSFVPLNCSTEPICYAAKALLPGFLYIIFILLGPCMSLSAFVNGNFAYYGVLLSGVCKDGWLPNFVGKTNRRGAPVAVNLWYYLTGMVPLLIGFDISETANFINFIWSIIGVIPCIAMFALPKKFPTAWKTSHLHIPNCAYYACCSLRFAINTTIAVISAINMGLIAVYIGTAVFLFILVYVISRCRSSEKPLYIHEDFWPLS